MFYVGIRHVNPHCSAFFPSLKLYLSLQEAVLTSDTPPDETFLNAFVSLSVANLSKLTNLVSVVLLQ